jgi:hypothetical protein
MTRASLSALFAVALVASCAIDDRKLEVHEGDDSRGGSGGTRGGASGKGGTDTGGTSGTGGTSTGGTSGKGGTSTGGTGKGGTSGTSGSGGFGAAEDCNGDPIEIDEALVQACLLQTGCNPFVPNTSVSFCISNQRLRTFSLDDCGTGATTCDDFLECSGQGYHTPQSCDTGEPVYCETETLGVSCSRYAYAIDCAKFGGVCQTYNDDAGDLRVWCRIPELDGCTEPSDTSQCDPNGVAYTCIGGTAFGNDCPELGSECRDGSCYYVLPGCSTTGATCGTATRLDRCYVDGDLARYECAPGLGCEEDDPANAECRAPGCTDTEPCAESCSGTELTFCYGRVPVTVDCGDYGFRKCLETTNDIDETFAFCAFPEGFPDRICEVEATDSACGTCAKQDCCAEWTACLDDPDCVGYLNCTDPCAADSICIEQCGTTYPLGLAAYLEFLDCRDAACGC